MDKFVGRIEYLDKPEYLGKFEQRKEMFPIEKLPPLPPVPRDSQKSFEITEADAWVLRDLLEPLVKDQDPEKVQSAEEVIKLRALYSKLECKLNPQPVGFLCWEEPLCSALRRFPASGTVPEEGWEAYLEKSLDKCLKEGVFLRQEDLQVGMEVVAPTLIGHCFAKITSIDNPPRALSGEHHVIFLEYRKDREGYCCVTGSAYTF